MTYFDSHRIHVNSNCTLIRIYDDSFQGEIVYKPKNNNNKSKKNNINNSLWWQSKKKLICKKNNTQNSAMILSLLINYPNTHV